MALRKKDELIPMDTLGNINLIGECFLILPVIFDYLREFKEMF